MTIKRGPRVYSEGNIVSYYDPLNVLSYVSGGYWYDLYNQQYSGSIDSATFHTKYFSTNGTNQQLNLGHNPNFVPPSSSGYSISFWVNFKENNKLLFTKERQFSLRISADNRVCADLRSTDDNRWIYGLTWDSNEDVLYAKIQRGGNHHAGFQIYDADLNVIKNTFEYAIDGTGVGVSSYSYYSIMTGSSYFTTRLYGWGEYNLYPNYNQIQVYQYNYAVGTDLNDVSWAEGIHADNEYVYFCNRQNHRINKADKSTGTMVSMSGTASAGSGEDEFNNPRGMVGDDTFLYVCDYSNHRIKKHYKTDLSFHSMSGSSGTGQDQYSLPYAIDISGSYLYITERGNDRIKIINKDTLEYVNMTGSLGTGPYKFDEPEGVAVNDDYIFVSNYNTGKVCKYTKNLEFVNEVGGISGYYQNDTGSYFYGYRGIFYYSETDKIYNIDRSSHYKILNENRTTFDYSTKHGKGDSYRLDISGSYIYMAHTDRDTIGKFTFPSCSLVSESVQVVGGTGSEEFNRPVGIAVDDTHIYVVDVDNDRIKKHLKSDLSYVHMTGSSGDGPYKFNQAYGLGLVDNKLVIGDYSNHRLYVYDKNLVYVTASVTVGSSYPVDITYDDNYIYSLRTGGSYIHRWDRYTYEHINSYTIGVSGEHLGGRSWSNGMTLDRTNGLMFLASHYNMRVFETSSFSNIGILGVWDSTIWTDPHVVETNKWHNIIFATDNTYHYLYVDGVLKKQIPFIEKFGHDNISDMIFGRYKGHEDDADYYVEEDVGMILVYNKVLLENDALQNYRGMRGRFL